MIKINDSSKQRQCVATLTVLLMILALLLAFAAPGFADRYHGGNNANYIGENAAKNIAIKDAGLTNTQVTVAKLTLHPKHTLMVYSIVLLADNTKYYYEVNAVTGDVVASYHNYRGPQRRYIYQDNPPPVSGNNQGTVNGDIIGAERARQIALNHAKVKSEQVYKYSQELEWDDGLWVYEIEFEYGRMEYEYIIDAYTGEIVEWEVDYDL